jgi:hypothetical protein
MLALGKSERHSENSTKVKRAEGMVHVVEHLLINWESLSSISSTTKN